MLANGAEGIGVDLEIRSGRVAEHAKHPHRVMLEALMRAADGAHDVAVQVVHAADVVDDAVVLDIVKQRVDGQIAAKRVFRRRSVMILLGLGRLRVRRLIVLAGLIVRRVAAERRDFNNLAAGEIHVRQSEAPADNAAVPEQRLHLFRPRVGGHVEILRRASENQIPHASAHQEGAIPVILEPVHHLQRVRVDVSPRNRVILPGNDKRLGFYASGFFHHFSNFIVIGLITP
ncbi:MAG: hypothetical protein M5R36_22305 [Deltaproteobacteria bacterium]|nr:hypothetical protein [Deltaproteobacteria bacterium]